jgi:hypothetical protein
MRVRSTRCLALRRDCFSALRLWLWLWCYLWCRSWRRCRWYSWRRRGWLRRKDPEWVKVSPVHLAVSIGEADPLPLLGPALIENPRLLLCSLCRAVPDARLCPGVCAARAIPAGVWNWRGVGEAIHRCALWIGASLLELVVCGAVVGDPLHDLAGRNARADLIYRSRIKAHIDDHRRARASRWCRRRGRLHRERRHWQQRCQGENDAGCEEWSDALQFNLRKPALRRLHDHP